VLSGVREDQSRGSNLHEFLWHTGLWHPQSKTVRILPDLDAAIAWVEDRLLGESEYAVTDEAPMKLQEMEIFCAYTDNTLKDLEASMTIHRFVAGQVIYVKGSSGDDLYWVRQGAVRLVASLKAGKTKPVASFGRGDFFGGLAFLDNQPRPNDAIARDRHPRCMPCPDNSSTKSQRITSAWLSTLPWPWRNCWPNVCARPRPS
jgi:SulP family sulfate permease